MGGNVPYTCRAVRLRFEIVSNRAAFGGAHTDTRRRCRLFRRPHRRRNRLGAALGTIWLAGLNAGFQLALADIFTLSESDIEGFTVDHTHVHLGDSFCCLIGVVEANETESLALAQRTFL